jgi:hypothetical protein
MLYSGPAPIAFTVLTEVCTISGDSSSVAAASTASRMRSSTMLIAATPYRSANYVARRWAAGG